MKFQPERYVNQIKCRKDNYKPLPGYNGAPLFDTWEAAHNWLLETRAQEVEAAHKQLKKAERSLKAATAMVWRR